MFSVSSKKQTSISNLLIQTNYTENNSIFDFNITYIDETSLQLEVNIIDGEKITLFLINKDNNKDILTIPIDNKNYVEIINLPFKLIVDESISFYKIPKIIHQSYKPNVKKNMYNAINSWKLMNINFEYKYWNDDDCIKLINEHFNENVMDAYNSLYAGAYKSDIFRLCVLYIYGGVWTDISSICKYPIDKIIFEKNNLIIVKDHPAQVNNGNIYQAFIITESNSKIIKFILDFTVDKVLNYEHYNNVYPQLINNSIFVTGPAVFAIGINKILGRNDTSIIKDKLIEHNSIDYGLVNIRLLDHYPGNILMDNITIIDTKYESWQNDRINTHYSKLFENGFVYKKKIKDIDVDILNPCIYQIWIQSEFTSINMYNAIQTIINNNNYFNYKLLTNEKIIKLIENDYEFPLLIKVYNKLIPYAYKSDLIRYYMLYKYGGVYIDIDFVNINGIQELYKNNDLVICKDINANNISNGFICCKKGNLFFKFLVEKIIDNILVNKINYKSDLEISGPIFFGKHFEEYFKISKPFNNGYYFEKNTRITILNHSINLPLPKGSWINSSRNIQIKYNTLYAECKNISGKWNETNITFYVEDEISNMNGKLISPSSLNRKSNFDKNSTFIYDENKLYFNSKYDNYDYEKVTFLDGNDFAVMYKSNNIINYDE